MANAVEIFVEEHKKSMAPPILRYELRHAYSPGGDLFYYATGEMFSDSKGTLAGKIEEFNCSLNLSLSRLKFPFSLSAISGSFEESGNFAYLEFIRLFSNSIFLPCYVLLERGRAGNGIGGHYEGIWSFPRDEFSKISEMPKAEKIKFFRNLGAEEAIVNLEQK